MRLELAPEDEADRKAVKVKVLREFFEGGGEEIPFRSGATATSSPTATP